MNSIVFTHVLMPPQGVSLLDTTLDRLSAWIDSELDSLEALLALADPGTAAADLAALRGLHLDADARPKEVGELLAEAEAPLDRLLDRVRAIPVNCPLAGPAPREYDAWLRWSGARLEDIVVTIRHGLEV